MLFIILDNKFSVCIIVCQHILSIVCELPVLSILQVQCTLIYHHLKPLEEIKNLLTYKYVNSF
jgi:hypothetical protein